MFSDELVLVALSFYSIILQSQTTQHFNSLPQHHLFPADIISGNRKSCASAGLHSVLLYIHSSASELG